MKSSLKTVDEYLASLPTDRREPLRTICGVMRSHMPAGYAEAMTWGMPTWEIPLEAYPDTYNKKPLMYAGIASQKNYMVIYLSAPYGRPELRTKLEEGFRHAGKKLDMGASCIRFNKLDDIPLDVIADMVASVKPAEYIRFYESARKPKK